MTGQVGAARGFKKVVHMNAIGWIIAAMILVVLLPLLPFIALLWVLGKLGQSSGRERGEIEAELDRV